MNTLPTFLMGFLGGVLFVLAIIKLSLRGYDKRHKFRMESITFFGKLHTEAFSKIIPAMRAGNWAEVNRLTQECEQLQKRINEL